jgi:hypothetical protein
MWNSAPQVHSRVSNINFDILIFKGHPMHIPWKLPKDGKVLSHLGLTNLSVWVGFCPSSPQQGIKYQLCYFDFVGGLCIPHEQLPKDGKVFSHLGFRSNVLYGPLTDLSVLVGFCTSRPQQGVKYQLWYLDFLVETLYISHGKMPKDGQVLPTRALDQRYYTNIQLTYVSRWDYAPQAHSRVLNIDFVIWILAGPYKYCMQNCQRTAKFFPTYSLY